MNVAADDPEAQVRLTAFVDAMRQSGWREGQNLRIEVRWIAGDVKLADSYAKELAGMMPDVIVADSTVNLAAIRRATSVLPVVFVRVADPVAQGFVTNANRPGGNLTGFSLYAFSFGGKWLDLLRQVAPALERVAVMFNPATAPYWSFFKPVVDLAAVSLGVRVIPTPVEMGADIEPALAGFAREPNGGLMLLGDSFALSHQRLIADLAKRNRLPSIAPGYDFARDGGLMDYGNTVGLVRQYQQAATYVDRILRGTKAGDLPVQAPDKYRFVVNLKTARALRLTIPETLLATADEVIQ